VSVGVVGQVRHSASILGAIWGEIVEKDVPFMARSVAFSAFLSLLPLLLLLVILATAFGGEALATRIEGLTREYLTPVAQGLVQESLSTATSRLGFSLFAVAVLTWSILGVFRGLDTAFSRLYDAPADEGFVSRSIDGLVVLVAITAALLATVAAGVALALLPDVLLVDVAGSLLLLLGLAVALFPLYYVFPDVDVSVREVLPGTVVAAIGWTILQAVFQFYVAVSATNQLYGAIGGVILLLTFLYLGAAVLLLGGATNVVLAGRHRALTAPRPD
jgi:membrane protein